MYLGLKVPQTNNAASNKPAEITFCGDGDCTSELFKEMGFTAHCTLPHTQVFFRLIPKKATEEA